MKSHVHKIEKGAQVLDAIFTECEKVSIYNELEHKQSLQLRLLCEELVNMLPFLVSDFNGEFWIETCGDEYQLCVSVSVEDMDFLTRERLIKVSKDNKNSSAVGITGKIRAVFDYMVMGSDDPMLSPAAKCGFATNIDFSQLWSLQMYRDSDQEEADKRNEWDEFERSIIGKLADDVIVGVRGQKVSMIIKKKLA